MRVSMLILISLMVSKVQTPDIEIDEHIFTIAFQNEFDGEALNADKWVYRTLLPEMIYVTNVQFYVLN